MKVGDLVITIPSVWPGSEQTGIILKLQYQFAWIYWDDQHPFLRAYKDELILIDTIII